MSAQATIAAMFFFRCLLAFLAALLAGSCGSDSLAPRAQSGPTVVVSGSVTGEIDGNLSLQLLIVPPDKPPELLQSASINAAREFSLDVPANLGPAHLVAFVLGGGEDVLDATAGARLDVEIRSEGLDGLVLEIGDLDLLGELRPGHKWGETEGEEPVPVEELGHFAEKEPPFLVGWSFFLSALVGIGLLRLVRPAQWSGWRWRRGLDWGLAAGLALFCTWACSAFLADESLEGGRRLGSDFARYCGSLGAASSGEWSQWHPSTSRISAYLSTPFVNLWGVIDAMLAIAVLSFAATVAACYLWASALHSRLAGVAAALFTLSLVPLVLISRTLSFYPLQVGLNSLCLALSTLALVRPGMASIGAASSAVALVLLSDVRGILVAVPAIFLLVLAVTRLTKARKSLGLGLVLAPLWLSWMNVDWAYTPDSGSLEQKVMALDVNRDAVQSGQWSVHVPKTEFHWGRTAIHKLPKSIWSLSKNSKSLAPIARDLPKTAEGRNAFVLPWRSLFALAVVLAVWSLRRRPWHLVALGVSSLPAWITLRTVTLVEFQLRFLAFAAPVVAVLLGIALATAVGTKGDSSGENKKELLLKTPLARLPPGSREVLALGALMALVFGAVPSDLASGSHLRPSVPAGQLGRALQWSSDQEWSGDLQADAPLRDELFERIGESHTPEWSSCARQLDSEFRERGRVEGRFFR